MIETCGLTKYYGSHPALEDVSFSIGEGETVGFLGANGAGKSTTMRILTGFIAPTSGYAKVAGFDLASDPIKARATIGYLPESTPLYREMRVASFLEYRSRLKEVPHSDRKKTISEAMEKCRIADVSDRIIGQLSKGYRQRVGLADCLLGDPGLLILDEPTVGLDPNQVVETRELIREIGEDTVGGKRRTVFLSTHILHEVELICSRIIIINKGRLVAEGKTDELCRKHAGTRTLALQLNAMEDPTEHLRAIAGIEEVTGEGVSAEGARIFTLKCKADTDARQEIATLAAGKGWLIQEMRLMPVRLEDIFARLTGAGVHDSSRTDIAEEVSEGNTV